MTNAIIQFRQMSISSPFISGWLISSSMCLAIIFLFSCGHPKTAENETPDQEATTNKHYFISLPTPVFKDLYQHADQLDIIFNDVPVSVSQNDVDQVRKSLAMLTPDRIPKDFDCRETASIIFQSKGEIVADGRMYINPPCHYVVFLENNEPKYATSMTDEAIEFYRRVMRGEVQKQ